MILWFEDFLVDVNDCFDIEDCLVLTVHVENLGGRIGILVIVSDGIRNTVPSGVRTTYIIEHVFGSNVDEIMVTLLSLAINISLGRKADTDADVNENTLVME